MNLSDLLIERSIDLDLENISILSVEALDDLLLSQTVPIESEDALLHFLIELGSGYRDLLRHIQIEFLSDDGLFLLAEHFAVPSESMWPSAVNCVTHQPCPRNSQIISDIPEIFADFQGKWSSLLWRGSRDGFSASEFHRRCDGHANTLIVILDTKGNIFGGFTPAKWESRVWNEASDEENNLWKADDSLKSFVFVLTNPDNAPRKWLLRPEQKQQAILCDRGWGPRFSGIAISNNCNLNDDSWVYAENSYAVTGSLLHGAGSFSRMSMFQVKEIEVFEIAL
jgi:hypothetical protein